VVLGDKMTGNDYNITYLEAEKLLGKSRKTISRYIRKGLLNPKKVKSKKKTLEYRFKRSELKSFKKLDRIDKTRQDKKRPDIDIIDLLKNQLDIKDKQIDSLGNKIDQLIERNRETNILIKGLQNKVLLIEGKTDPIETINEHGKKDKKRPDIRQDRGKKIKDFIRKLFSPGRTN
jgi:predicted DNA-binding transcriptional regulator AlpA